MLYTQWLELEREKKDADWEKDFNDWFLKTYDENNGYPFDDKDKLARFLIWECQEVDAEYGENRRWSRSVNTIVQIGDRFFSIGWEEGLTEMQPNEYLGDDIVEVRKVKKVIEVEQWEEVPKDARV